MPAQENGRWAIIETVGDYHEHTSIRCFFESEATARERWDAYYEYERERREVRFIEYGAIIGF